MDTKPICPSCGKPLEPNAPKGLCPECLMKGAFPTGTEAGSEHEKKPRFIPPTVEELAQHFPQLEILEFIGQGGMGAVYKARQKQLDRIVALKILPPQVASGPGFAERFTREARALAKLNHPHIVTLYEFGQTDGLFYFLMEFVDGINLRQLLNASRIAPKEALAIVPQICDALQFAHERGIVHRDIKPENILLSKEGQVKIADFGVAKIVAQDSGEKTETIPGSQSGELTEAGSVLGTPQYMAPEQVVHPLEVDHRADIYSLGVVFYQMLTGELPTGKFEPPSKKVVIDVRLDEVVLRALEKTPELRWQTVADMRTHVETISRVGDSAHVSPRYHRPASLRDRWPWDAAFVSGTTAVLCLLPMILMVCLLPVLHLKALFFLFLELIPALNGAIYLTVLRKLDRLRGSAPSDALEMAEGLFATRSQQSPALAALARDRLELIPISGQPVTVFLKDIESVTEIRWFNGKRLLWKRGLKIQSRNAPAILLALAEPVFLHWKPFLTGEPSPMETVPAKTAEAAPLSEPGVVRDAATNKQTNKSPIVRLVEILFDITFTSTLAIKLVNLSGLGFLGFLSFLVYAFPERHWCLGLSSLFGFFGLIGFAYMVEMARRRKSKLAAGAFPTDATPDRPLPANTASAKAHFSRAAIVGACWTPLFFITFVFNVQSEYRGPLWGQLLLMVTLLPLGFAAPFGTTILGWLAVSQIRRSAGKLYGMWLAVFDGLLFPLLAVDLVITRLGCFVWQISGAASLGYDYHDLTISIDAIIIAVACAVVDFLIIRRIWRAVNSTKNTNMKKYTIATITVLCLAAVFLAACYYWPVKSDYIGESSFPKSDSIKIISVSRTQKQMVVKGLYNLVSADSAQLALYITTPQDVMFPTDPGQLMEISNGQGKFELSTSHLVPGWPHLTMYLTNGTGFAGVYFGTKKEAAEERERDVGDYQRGQHSSSP